MMARKRLAPLTEVDIRPAKTRGVPKAGRVLKRVSDTLYEVEVYASADRAPHICHISARRLKEHES